MLIKAVTKVGKKGGIVVPHEPKEIYTEAIVRAAKLMNSSEWIFWPIKKTAELKVFKTSAKTDENGKPAGWRAWAEGHVMVGKTRIKDDTFFKPRKHTFKVHYESTSDSMGLPDIKISAQPELVEVERNPSKINGIDPVNQVPQVVLGELSPKEPKAKRKRTEKSS